MTVCKLHSVWLYVLLTALAGCRTMTLVTISPPKLLAQLGWTRSAEELAWDRWADVHLRSGDLVFVRGDSRILFGLVNFSQLCTDVADSRFSHVGLVSREPDGVYVYDVVVGGPRHISFGKFATDNEISLIAVKRLKLEYRNHIPAALDYCHTARDSSCKFDTEFKLDNGDFYCSELVELAFRHAGLPLSEPIRIDHLPRIGELPATTKILIATMTNIRMDQAIFVPGNDQIGIWSCPHLELVLDATKTDLLADDITGLAMPFEPATPTGSNSGRNFSPAGLARTAWVGPADRDPRSTGAASTRSEPGGDR